MHVVNFETDIDTCIHAHAEFDNHNHNYSVISKASPISKTIQVTII